MLFWMFSLSFSLSCASATHASVTRTWNLFTRVFSCFQTAKSLEKTFKTTLRQNNTKILAAYGPSLFKRSVCNKCLQTQKSISSTINNIFDRLWYLLSQRLSFRTLMATCMAQKYSHLFAICHKNIHIMLADDFLLAVLLRLSTSDRLWLKH